MCGVSLRFVSIVIANFITKIQCYFFFSSFWYSVLCLFFQIFMPRGPGPNQGPQTSPSRHCTIIYNKFDLLNHASFLHRTTY